jgi:hypothetical protein
MKLRSIFATVAGKDGKGGDPDRIRAMISDIERQRETAHEALASLAERRVDALMDDDLPGVNKIDNEAQKCHFEIDQAEIALPKLQQALADALSRDAEAERLARYDAAKASLKSGVAALARYEKWAHEGVEILRVVAEGELAVMQANADLPTGAKPLTGVEQQVRGLAGEPERILSEHIEEPRWFFVGHFKKPVAPEDYQKIRRDERDPNRGVLPTQYADMNPHHVIRRQEKVTRYLPARGAFAPVPLACDVRLPGFAPGAPAVWTGAADPLMHHAGMAGTVQEVLAEATRSADAAKQAPRDPRGDSSFPEIRREWIEIDEAAEAEIAAGMPLP